MEPEGSAEHGDASPVPWFTTTHWSVVLAAGQVSTAEADAALERLCRVYWWPLYAFVRRRGHAAHDAQDLIDQGGHATTLRREPHGEMKRS